MANYLELISPQIPLNPISWEKIKSKTIDPTTNKPYKGVILEGIFADLTQKPNNNKRIYDIPKYLKLLEKLKLEIHESKGVFGEYEHPQGYNVNGNNISHKILDVWYEPETFLVKGIVLLLDTVNGLNAQQVIKSGGQLAISARAAGSETELPDGTKSAEIQLLVTYDLVYHPGFSEAVLKFKCLNESEKYLQSKSKLNNGFSVIIYEDKDNNSTLNTQNLKNSYDKYINSNIKDECFLSWFSKINESSQQQQNENKLDNDDIPNEKDSEKKLKNATNQELKQSFFNKVELYQQKLLRKRKGGEFFDNSAGFIKSENDDTTNLQNISVSQN